MSLASFSVLKTSIPVQSINYPQSPKSLSTFEHLRHLLPLSRPHSIQYKYHFFPTNITKNIHSSNLSSLNHNTLIWNIFHNGIYTINKALILPLRNSLPLAHHLLTILNHCFRLSPSFINLFQTVYILLGSF